MIICEKIKFIREYNKQNQKEFAEKLEVTQSTISKYEKGTREPDYSFLKNLFNNYDVNPNWIFFDELPQINYVDELGVSNENRQLLIDINNLLGSSELHFELNKILIDKTISCIASANDDLEKSSIRKFLESIKLEGHIPFRPLLFLYYIFRYMKDNPKELNNLKSNSSEFPYRDYLIDLVKRYNVLSFKNNPAFTSKIKKEFQIAIEINLTENDSKRLLINYEQALKDIESKMPQAIVRSHRRINTKVLFPKL